MPHSADVKKAATGLQRMLCSRLPDVAAVQMVAADVTTSIGLRHAHMAERTR